jgi:excisionase family DNA binding protein
MSKPTPTPPSTLPRLFSIKQVAEHTGLSRRTIVAALSSGDLEHYRVGSRAIIPETAIIAWLESKRIGRRPRLRRQPEEAAL